MPFDPSDDFSSIDAAKWSEYDPAGDLSISYGYLFFAGNQSETAYLLSRYVLQGDFDFEISWLTGEAGFVVPVSGANSVSLRLLTDAGSEAYVGRTQSATQGQYFAGGTGLSPAWLTTSDEYGKLRIARSGSVVRGWIWANDQWEWDGDTAGVVLGAVGDDDVYLKILFGAGEMDEGPFGQNFFYCYAANLSFTSGTAVFPVGATAEDWEAVRAAGAVVRYYCTLSGAEDGTTDAELPISSLQVRLISDGTTYLGVVVPGVEYATQIADRSSGYLSIDQALVGADGSETARKQIARVQLETIRPDYGANSRSISLSGYGAETFDGGTLELSGHNYRSVQSGKIHLRYPRVNPYVEPGMVLADGDDELSIGSVSIYVAPNSMPQMEVAEA